MNTSATFNDITMIVLVCIVGGLLLFIGPGLIKEGFASTINPLKKLVGFDEKEKQDQLKEQERVKQELLAEAKTVYTAFSTALSKCTSTKDTFCECGTFDYLKLNNYQLLVSNTAKKVSLVEEGIQTPIQDTQMSFSSNIFVSLKPKVDAFDKQIPDTYKPDVIILHRNGYSQFKEQKKNDNTLSLTRMIILGPEDIVLAQPQQSTIVKTTCS